MGSSVSVRFVLSFTGFVLQQDLQAEKGFRAREYGVDGRWIVDMISLYCMILYVLVISMHMRSC
jgi:hypothetical protein